MDKIFFAVGFFHQSCPTNSKQTTKGTYKKHKDEKKRSSTMPGYRMWRSQLLLLWLPHFKCPFLPACVKRTPPAGGGGVRFAHSRRKGHIKCGNSFGFLDSWWYGGRSNSLSLDLLWSYVVGYLPLKLARAAFSARMLLFCSCRFLSLGLPGSAGPLSLSLR